MWNFLGILCTKHYCNRFGSFFSELFEIWKGGGGVFLKQCSVCTVPAAIVHSRPSMFQLSVMSVMCLILLSWMSSFVWKILVELQSKLQCRTLVKLVIRFRRSTTKVGRCWARLSGHGSSSVSSLSKRSMNNSDDRLADSSNTRGSMDEMMLLVNVKLCSCWRLLKTSSCRQQKQSTPSQMPQITGKEKFIMNNL